MTHPFELTIPSDGSSTSTQLFSAALASTFKELLLLQPAPAVTPSAQRSLVAFRNLLATMARSSKAGPLLAVLRRPTVSALLRCQRDRSDARAASLLQIELACTILFELALFEVLPGPIRFDAVPRRILSLSHSRSIETPAKSVAMVFENGRIRFVAGTGEATVVDWKRAPSPYLPVDGSVVLALADNNPLASLEAHPDKRGSLLDLGGKPTEQWRASLERALGIIGTYVPEIRRELDVFAQVVVPVGYHDERHESASYREVLGSIYMTLHPHDMTMAEAIIHEGSHNKLNTFFELDDVLTNGDSPLYTSPVRPDPRPLRGVLLAVHAFLPVARLYEQMIAANDPRVNASFLRRYNDVLRINAEGYALLAEHAQPTEKGRALFDELGRWATHYQSVIDGVGKAAKPE